MSTAQDNLPVWMVQGSNWIAEVQLKEKDLFESLKKGEQLACQAEEACTQAIERLFPLWRPLPEDERVNRDEGVENGTFIEMLDANQPNIGTYLEVRPKHSENQDDIQYLRSYEILANGGYYEMSKINEVEYLKDAEQADAAIRDLNLQKKSRKRNNRRKKKN